MTRKDLQTTAVATKKASVRPMAFRLECAGLGTEAADASASCTKRANLPPDLAFMGMGSVEKPHPGQSPHAAESKGYGDHRM